MIKKPLLSKKFCWRELQIAWCWGRVWRQSFCCLLGQGSLGPWTPCWEARGDAGTSHPFGFRRGFLASLVLLCACFPFPCGSFPIFSLTSPCHSHVWRLSPHTVLYLARALGSHPTPPSLSLTPDVLCCSSLPLCLPVFSSSSGSLPPFHAPTPCPLPRVFLRPFPGTVKASIVPLHFDKP